MARRINHSLQQLGNSGSRIRISIPANTKARLLTWSSDGSTYSLSSQPTFLRSFLLTLSSNLLSKPPLSYIIILDCVIHKVPSTVITHPKLPNPNMFLYMIYILWVYESLVPTLTFECLNHSLWNCIYFSSSILFPYPKAKAHVSCPYKTFDKIILYAYILTCNILQN
jgi:hypothetical protein